MVHEENKNKTKISSILINKDVSKFEGIKDNFIRYFRYSKFIDLCGKW